MAATGSDLSFWSAALVWISDQKVVDVASIAGVLISIVGFGVTLHGVRKSKNAAVRAEEAATAMRNSIRLLDTIIDFSAAISLLEEIKRLHRAQAWNALPDRYAALRKLLISVRKGVDLREDQESMAQGTITNLATIETQVEKAIGANVSPSVHRLNTLLSADLDNLIAVLTDLKAEKSGAA
jgi:hypothetical protein